MKKLIILLGLCSLISSNASFLRNLSQATLAVATATAATYPNDKCPSVGYPFTITTTVGGSTDVIDTKITTDKIVLTGTATGATTTTDVKCSCEIPTVSAGTAPTISCKTTEAIPQGNFGLKAISTAATLETGVTLTVVAGTNYATAKNGYLYLGDNTSGSKDIVKKNATFPMTFDINYASTVTDATKPTVKAGSVTLSKCEVATGGKKLTCTIEEDTLAGDKDDDTKVVEYAVTVKNACDEEEATGIVLKVSNNASFVAFSKFALLALSLLLL